MTADDPPSPGGWADRDLRVVTDAGHADEFVAFVETAKDPLHRLAYFLSGDHHRAEELTQQTFERTWRSWRHARQGDPLAYARTILANLRVDTWRRTRHEVLTGLDHDARRHAPDATRGLERDDEDDLTWQCEADAAVDWSRWTGDATS